MALRLGMPAEALRRKNFYRGSGATNTTHYGEEIDDNRLAKVWDGLLSNKTSLPGELMCRLGTMLIRTRNVASRLRR